MPEKALLIVNPYSGKKNGEETASFVAQKLAAQGIACEIFISRSLEKLDAFIRELRQDNFRFAGIIGGDGTMHEFMNAVLRHHPDLILPVALFPCGTGNAFNFDIGCASIDETLACIFAESISPIDVAEVTYSDRTLWSFNILGCGLVAEINSLAERLRFFGGMRYNIASVIKLLANPVYRMKVKSDESGFEGKYSFMLACNTRYTGKGMMMAPMAQLNDGKFDVLLVEACSVWKLLGLFPKIFKGKHIGADVLTYLQTTRFEISCEEKKLATNIDGEIKGATPLKFVVHRDKIRAYIKK